MNELLKFTPPNTLSFYPLDEIDASVRHTLETALEKEIEGGFIKRVAKETQEQYNDAFRDTLELCIKAFFEEDVMCHLNKDGIYLHFMDDARLVIDFEQLIEDNLELIEKDEVDVWVKRFRDAADKLESL